MFAQFKLDNGESVSIPISKVDKIYGAMDELQSVTVVKTDSEKYILHWNRVVEFSDNHFTLGMSE